MTLSLLLGGLADSGPVEARAPTGHQISRSVSQLSLWLAGEVAGGTLDVQDRASTDTMRQIDRLGVLVWGRIVEEGTHEELLARGGLYALPYQRQFRDERSAPGPTDVLV